MRENAFKPAWWLRNPHCQTLWPALCRKEPKTSPLLHERFELADGDFIDISWLPKKNRPIVLILHGFEGTIQSHYAKGMLQTIFQQGWQAVFMHFRGCSGMPNRLARAYHSGETSDIATLINILRERSPQVPIAAVGFSLGGNVLLKWLGETGDHNPLAAAVAISVPFDLHKTVVRINKGFSKLYQWYLLKYACKKLIYKFQDKVLPNNVSLSKIKTMRDFDDKITAPLHGFANADEYYSRCSSRQYLHGIRKPTLLIHAKDDPFMTETAIPKKSELSPFIQLDITEKGGHVGFVSGRYPWNARYWLEERVPIFLKKFF